MDMFETVVLVYFFVVAVIGFALGSGATLLVIYLWHHLHGG